MTYHLAVFTTPQLLFGSTVDSMSSERAKQLGIQWAETDRGILLTRVRVTPAEIETVTELVPWTTIGHFRTVTTKPNVPAPVEAPKPDATKPQPPRR